MPQPHIIAGVHSQAEQPPNLDTQQVQPVRLSLDSGDQPPLVVVDPECSVLRMDVAASFIKLPEANYVRGQPQDVVHSRERKMFIGLPLKQHCALALDGALQPITKLDSATDRGVDVDEGPAAPRQVVGSTIVDVPQRVIPLRLLIELDKNPLLDDM
jgi:hypothetical protein